jgi:hypothetical protein
MGSDRRPHIYCMGSVIENVPWWHRSGGVSQPQHIGSSVVCAERTSCLKQVHGNNVKLPGSCKVRSDAHIVVNGFNIIKSCYMFACLLTCNLLCMCMMQAPQSGYRYRMCSRVVRVAPAWVASWRLGRSGLAARCWWCLGMSQPRSRAWRSTVR